VAPSSNKLVITLTYAAPLDLIASSTYGAWIVSPKALDAVAKDSKYFESGVDGGSGPYQIQSYKAGTEVVLSRYDNHWGTTKPFYSIVDVLITPDGVTAQQMLTSGQVDYTADVPTSSIKAFKNNPKFVVKQYASPFNYVGYFNTLRAPLNDVRVRQALSYAIPYKDIVAIGGQGFGSQARGPVPQGIFPYDPKTPQYTTDLKKARSLLAKAGVKNLTLKLTYASENTAEARFVPLIKSAFASIGVKVNIQAMLFNQHWAFAKKDPAKAQDIFLILYWPTYSDAGADNLYSMFHSSAKPFFNLSYWKNKKYDGLIDKAATLTGSHRAASQALYSSAMKTLYSEAPGISLYDQKIPFVVPKALSGFYYNINYPFSMFFSALKPSK
jgi:peptide/nickel transport system substrate-binding protein